MKRRQVTEIPPVKAEVTEHQMIERQCPCCGTRTRAKAPDGVTAPVQYGPRAAALGVYLWHGQFLSRDRACAAMAEMFGCAPSPGALAAMARKIAGLIAPALDAIVRALAASQVAHFDETGFRVGREAGLGALGIVGEVRAGHRTRQARQGGHGRRRGPARLRRASPATTPGSPTTATTAWPGTLFATLICSGN